MANLQIRQSWRKRIQVLNLIYDDLLVDHTNEKSVIITSAFEKLYFDHYQIEILESYFDHYDDDKKVIEDLLKANWTYQRLNVLTKAIIHEAIAEARLKKVNKAILIDQALITCKTRGNIRDKNFINAILDKIIK